jgi:hypothetical protein
VLSAAAGLEDVEKLATISADGPNYCLKRVFWAVV